MMQQTVFSLFMIAGLLSASTSRADLVPMSGSEDGSISAEQVTLVGKVKFEQRILKVVTGDRSQQPPSSAGRKYWSLVILSNGSKYVFDRRYNEGLPAPESIEMELIQGGAKVNLRPGSTVKIEGQAVYAAPTLFKLVQVRSVSLLMDVAWKCMTFQEQSPLLLTQVWNTGEENGHKTFSITVDRMAGDRALFQVASVYNAQVEEKGDRSIFGGENHEAKVELNIQHPSQQSKDFPGVLKIAGQNLFGGREVLGSLFPIESVMDMICNPPGASAPGPQTP